MTKKLTITIDDEVYDGLYRHVGPRKISRFLENLARPHVTESELDEAYQHMAADEVREQEAEAWSEGVLEDVADEPR